MLITPYSAGRYLYWEASKQFKPINSDVVNWWRQNSGIVCIAVASESAFGVNFCESRTGYVGMLWRLSQALQEQWLVRLHYKKENDDHAVIRVVEPQGIIFSEYYFYLIACIHDANYDFPAVYRIDRIKEMAVLEKHYPVSNCKRFEEGEFRRRVQFMQAGTLLRIRFKFWGDSFDAVMDRLPTARVVERKGKVILLEAEVFGQGIKMWLLSQAIIMRNKAERH